MDAPEIDRARRKHHDLCPGRDAPKIIARISAEVRLKVGDLDEALRRMEATGGALIAGPMMADNSLHETRRVATVQTPEKTWLSVWEGG